MIQSLQTINRNRVMWLEPTAASGFPPAAKGPVPNSTNMT